MLQLCILRTLPRARIVDRVSHAEFENQITFVVFLFFSFSLLLSLFLTFFAIVVNDMDPDVDMKNSPDATTEAPTNDATAEQTDQTPQVDVSSSPPPASSTPEQQQPTEAAATTDATPSETTNATSSETPETHPPKNDSPAQSQPQYVNSPSSWQIPPNVFHQSKQQQQQQQQQTMTYDPHHHMLDKAKRRREQLEQRIQENDEDLDAWYSLMGDVQQSGDLEATRAVYERFLNLYPTSVRTLDKREEGRERVGRGDILVHTGLAVWLASDSYWHELPINVLLHVASLHNPIHSPLNTLFFILLYICAWGVAGWRAREGVSKLMTMDYINDSLLTFSLSSLFLSLFIVTCWETVVDLLSFWLL